MLIFILLSALKPYYDAKQVPVQQFFFFAFGLYYRKMKVLCGVEGKVGVREEEWSQDMTQVRVPLSQQLIHGSVTYKIVHDKEKEKYTSVKFSAYSYGFMVLKYF